MVAAAIVGTAVVSGAVAYNAAENAEDAQFAATQQANATARDQYGQTRADLLPYNRAGQNALTQLMRMTKGNPAAMQAMLRRLPGYQFARTQGLKAVQNAYGARGLGLSGAALKGAGQFATGLADQTFGAQWDRLMGVATLGENAAAQIGAFGTKTADIVGNNLIGAGNAQAASQIAQGQAIGSAAGSVGNMYLTNSLLQQHGYPGFFGGGGGGGGGGGYTGLQTYTPDWSYGAPGTY